MAEAVIEFGNFGCFSDKLYMRKGKVLTFNKANGRMNCTYTEWFCTWSCSEIMMSHFIFWRDEGFQMSFVLAGYSNQGCAEFILPEAGNANHRIVLDKKIFGTIDNTEIYLETMDHTWRFMGVSKNCGIDSHSVRPGQYIKSGDMMYLFSGAVRIAVAAIEFTPDIGGIKKYSLKEISCISAGSVDDNDIILEGIPLVSRKHARLAFDGSSCLVTDLSGNGTFLNGKRVQGTARASYGDCISFFGVQMIWLGDVLSVSTKCGKWHCTLKEAAAQEAVSTAHASAETKNGKQYFRRSPRNVPRFYDEAVEIEAPPQPQKTVRHPLFLTIGPSFTMALPMIIGMGVTVFGAGAQANTYMYTGIIISVLSAIIGIIWAVINLNYAKKQEIATEQVRTEKYKAYLARIEHELSEKYRHNTQNLRYIYPDSSRCAQYDRTTAELWNRNIRHDDFLYLRLGVGEQPFQCPIAIPQQRFSLLEDGLAAKPSELSAKFKNLKDVPIGIDLRQKHLVGLIGNDWTQTMAIMRSIVIQAAANICYTDLKMVFLFDGASQSDMEMWAFARWLPHTWSADRRIRYFAANEAERREVCHSLANSLRLRAENNNKSGEGKEEWKPYYIVFVSTPDLLEGIPAAKYLMGRDNDLGVTTILLADRCDQLPNDCVDIIQNDSSFSGIYNTELGAKTQEHIAFDSIDEKTADTFARRISGLEVHEVETGGEIPDTLTFLELYHTDRLDRLNVSDRWAKNRTYETMRVPIGQKAGGGTLELDIHENAHGPHGLVAGTTGSGKSETLQTYILSLAINFSPTDVAFFLIDFKGGGMANLFAGLPHTAGHISNLSGNQIHRAMVSIKSEIRRRQRLFGEYGVNHIDQYTKMMKRGETAAPVPHLFIVIDEFAELKRDEPDFMRELISVAQVGRSLGVHLILATQKPGGTVDDNIWSNTRFKLCLRVQDRQDSSDVLHKPDAAYLAQAGRAYLQVGNDEIYELFQSAWSGAPYYDNPAWGNMETVCLWDNMGQPAVTGDIQKAKRLEQEKLAWLTTLYHCSCDAAAQAGILPDSTGESPGFWTALRQNVKKAGYDLTDNPASAAQVLGFIKMCNEISGTTGPATAPAAAMDRFKQEKKQLPEFKEKTQLSAVVEYLAQIWDAAFAKERRFTLWLPVLPCEIFFFDMEHTQMFNGEIWPDRALDASLAVPVGMYDDPENQSQAPLMIDLVRDGHLAVCGSASSGKSTFLQTFLFALVNRYSAKDVNIYIIDYSNRLLDPFAGLCHVGGVVFDNEPDKVKNLFSLLSHIIANRKQLFQGGNYAQYIKSGGEDAPCVVVVIDNYASFREKTGDKYDGDLITLSREGASYGIYLVISAGGFGAGELQNRIAENFRSAVCLNLGERFKYLEILGNQNISVLPEANVKGRGLANVSGRALEFQTALAVKASDDYNRGEKLRMCFAEMNRAWSGIWAREIPMIPVRPTWKEFLNYDNECIRTYPPRYLPFAWNGKDASVASIDLPNTFCWFITGKPRTGKTNLIKVLASSAALSPSKRYIIDFSGTKLHKFAEENGAMYISNAAELFDTLKDMTPTFKERNSLKKELLATGCEENDIFDAMGVFPPIYLFIDDLDEVLEAVYAPPAGVGAMAGFVENITEKGAFLNIYIIAGSDPSSSTHCVGRKVFANMTSYGTGIHLGGNTVSQHIFDFSTVPYSEQAKVAKPGIGLIPPDNSNSGVREVVIPLVK